ncbi:hypothetical protein ACFW5W_24590 [Streptomyces sp. NPDC058783]|uniref:hypothetical protein n=1 Tax=Streptomyces sp. NPDC058783 TaxID=3346633 RepID=UPI0036CF6399
MFETIWGRCHIRADDRRAAERVVGRLAARLDRPLRTETYERYGRYPEMAQMCLTSPLGAVGPAAALHTVLRSAWLPASPWALGAPTADGEFGGVASVSIGSRFVVPGVEWMEFHVNDLR